jgi:hypothetical protein
MKDIYNLTIKEIDEEIKYRNNLIEEYKNNEDGIINTAKSEIEYLEYIKNNLLV